MTNRNRTYQNGKVSTHFDVQCGSANRKTSFSGRGTATIKLPFSGHIANKTILQLNIEGLTASKMNVLHHLAMQFEALVILPGLGSHCRRALAPAPAPELSSTHSLAPAPAPELSSTYPLAPAPAPQLRLRLSNSLVNK